MDGLLILGFILQAFYFTLFAIYIRNRRAKKRLKEKLSQPTIDLDEGLTGDTIPVISVVVNVRPFQIPIEKKEDFIPKKNMKYHTLEEPIEYYSEDAVEDEGCGCANVCDNCYDTTDYEYPF